MPAFGPNFQTVLNDLLEFSETTETLVFNKRNALLGYEKMTDTHFIFSEDGTPVDYKKEGILPNSNGNYYLRVEALLPKMMIHIPDVGKVKIVDAKLGKLFTHRAPEQAVNSLQITKELLDANERDMNVWIFTIDKDLFNNSEACKSLYDWLGTTGSTVDLNGEKLKIQMNKEIFDLMVKDSELKPTQLVDMYYNTKGVNDKWTITNLLYNESDLAAVTAQKRSDRMGWVDMIVSHLNEFTRDQQLKETAATQTTAGGYSIYANPLEVFVNKMGYELNQVYATTMVGAFQVDQILDKFLGKDHMNGPNDIYKKENTHKIFVPGKEYTHMQGAWDKAFGTIWGNLDDAKTMKKGISKFAVSESDIDFYRYLYEINERPQYSGIAQELFDAFVSGRTAINNDDYVTRDIKICIIRKLVSRVILQKTMDYLDEAISTVTQVGVINNPSPDRIHALSQAMGLLYSCTFTNRGLDYLTIYDKHHSSGDQTSYVSTQFLLAAGVLKQTGTGATLKYELGQSTWLLLSKEGIDLLKACRYVVAHGLLENNPPFIYDSVKKTWEKKAFSECDHKGVDYDWLLENGLLSGLPQNSALGTAPSTVSHMPGNYVVPLTTALPAASLVNENGELGFAMKLVEQEGLFPSLTLMLSSLEQLEIAKLAIKASGYTGMCL